MQVAEWVSTENLTDALLSAGLGFQVARRRSLVEICWPLTAARPAEVLGVLSVEALSHAVLVLRGHYHQAAVL